MRRIDPGHLWRWAFNDYRASRAQEYAQALVRTPKNHTRVRKGIEGNLRSLFLWEPQRPQAIFLGGLPPPGFPLEEISTIPPPQHIPDDGFHFFHVVEPIEHMGAWNTLQYYCRTDRPFGLWIPKDWLRKTLAPNWDVAVGGLLWGPLVE